MFNTFKQKPKELVLESVTTAADVFALGEKRTRDSEGTSEKEGKKRKSNSSKDKGLVGKKTGESAWRRNDQKLVYGRTGWPAPKWIEPGTEGFVSRRKFRESQLVNRETGDPAPPGTKPDTKGYVSKRKFWDERRKKQKTLKQNNYSPETTKVKVFNSVDESERLEITNTPPVDGVLLNNKEITKEEAAEALLMLGQKRTRDSEGASEREDKKRKPNLSEERERVDKVTGEPAPLGTKPDTEGYVPTRNTASDVPTRKFQDEQRNKKKDDSERLEMTKVLPVFGVSVVSPASFFKAKGNSDKQEKTTNNNGLNNSGLNRNSSSLSKPKIIALLEKLDASSNSWELMMSNIHKIKNGQHRFRRALISLLNEKDDELITLLKDIGSFHRTNIETEFQLDIIDDFEFETPKLT